MNVFIQVTVPSSVSGRTTRPNLLSSRILALSTCTPLALLLLLLLKWEHDPFHFNHQHCIAALYGTREVITTIPVEYVTTVHEGKLCKSQT